MLVQSKIWPDRLWPPRSGVRDADSSVLSTLVGPNNLQPIAFVVVRRRVSLPGLGTKALSRP